MQSDAQRRQKALEEEREAQASEPLKDFRRTSMSTHRASTENAEPEHAGAEGQEISQDLRDIAQESLLGKRTSEAMLDMYVPMETWYLRNSLEKVRCYTAHVAHKEGLGATNSRPLVSTGVPD